MAAPSAVVDAVSPPGPGFALSERDLARSEEEEKLLKKIRDQKERLWCEIQVRSTSYNVVVRSPPCVCVSLAL